MSTFQAYMAVATCVLLSRYKIQPIGMVSVNDGFEPLSNESIVSERDKIKMSPTKRSYRLVHNSTTIIVLACFGLAFLLVNYGFDILHGFFWPVVYFFFLFGLIVVAMTVICLQPQNKFDLPFQAPFVPFLPAVSILISATVMMSLSLLTWSRFSVWVSLGNLKIKFLWKFQKNGKNKIFDHCTESHIKARKEYEKARDNCTPCIRFPVITLLPNDKKDAAFTSLCLSVWLLFCRTK